jgi:hypothetical protein
MKFVSTNGKVSSVDIRPSKWPRKTYENRKSAFQWQIGDMLASLYPNDVILEDFTVPDEKLYIDFFLPRRRLAVEAMGEQHYKFNAHFHGSKEAFNQSRKRDGRKEMWCSLNDIILVKIEFDDDEEEVREKLSSYSA